MVACGNESVTGGQPSMTPSSSSSSNSSEPGGSVVDQAKADLTKRLGVDAAQVSVVSSEDVTWPDGSLGCPEPGMRYTQALVPGNRTVLEAGGKQYSYHSGGHRAPFLCEHPQPPSR
ncbi:hypothetical protein EV137_6669 [Kribbella pratensis]|uniref:PASTA domain-containing protein n=1 Tax=Kribbella pratensis TaxID=2512112 RepID=A0ABY2F671_9ACTN|nr:hypothetical protein EV137_6669 [Kribbella pratensis]